MEWNALAPSGVADIMFVTTPLLSIKMILQVLLSTRVGPADDDLPLYK